MCVRCVDGLMQQGPRLVSCLEQAGVNATDVNKLKEAGMYTVDAVRSAGLAVYLLALLLVNYSSDAQRV